MGQSKVIPSGALPFPRSCREQHSMAAFGSAPAVGALGLGPCCSGPNKPILNSLRFSPPFLFLLLTSLPTSFPLSVFCPFIELRLQALQRRDLSCDMLSGVFGVAHTCYNPDWYSQSRIHGWKGFKLFPWPLGGLSFRKAALCHRLTEQNLVKLSLGCCFLADQACLMNWRGFLVYGYQ